MLSFGAATNEHHDHENIGYSIHQEGCDTADHHSGAVHHCEECLVSSNLSQFTSSDSYSFSSKSIEISNLFDFENDKNKNSIIFNCLSRPPPVLI
tara:strand:+ start:134 stop:418 length:285 start_codon:yes stop_codon:yes gene_type:complete